MALKDYFIEKSIRESGIIKGPDSWTLQYINVGRARNILEAFDDDANGFVTVSEVNNFTRLRPEGWRCAVTSRMRVIFSPYPLPAFPTG